MVSPAKKRSLTNSAAHPPAEGLVAVRWVYVHDLSGSHRDEYSADLADEMTPLVE